MYEGLNPGASPLHVNQPTARRLRWQVACTRFKAAEIQLQLGHAIDELVPHSRPQVT